VTYRKAAAMKDFFVLYEKRSPVDQAITVMQSVFGAVAPPESAVFPSFDARER
jgi:hypothetical protein